jgi:hypothetical protein
MTERDDDGEDQSEQEAEDDENESVSPEAPAAAPERRAGKSSKSKAEARSARHKAKSSTGQLEKRSAPGLPPRAIGLGVVALVAGAAAGWFGHEAQAKAKLRSESAPAPAGSSGVCHDWRQKICAGSGEQSATCEEAKGASELLTEATCEAALFSVPATLAKAKAARASCDNLVSKLCKDLPEGSQACALVKDKTPSFPATRCKEMLEHYDEVIGQLRMMDQQMPPGMGMGGPHGAMPPGSPAP